MPERAEALVDVVGLLLPCAGRTGPGAPAPLASREVHDPKARVLALLADEFDLASQSPGGARFVGRKIGQTVPYKS